MKNSHITGPLPRRDTKNLTHGTRSDPPHFLCSRVPQGATEMFTSAPHVGCISQPFLETRALIGRGRGRSRGSGRSLKRAHQACFTRELGSCLCAFPPCFELSSADWSGKWAELDDVILSIFCFLGFWFGRLMTSSVGRLSRLMTSLPVDDVTSVTD